MLIGSGYTFLCCFRYYSVTYLVHNGLILRYSFPLSAVYVTRCPLFFVKSISSIYLNNTYESLEPLVNLVRVIENLDLLEKFNQT